jgi:hypothetical protein
MARLIDSPELNPFFITSRRKPVAQRKHLDLVKLAENQGRVNAMVDQLQQPSTDTPTQYHWPEQFAAFGPVTAAPRLEVLAIDPEP